MNKTKFFSSLLVAVLFATTSVFVSCKDYDDDIKNLQSQIDKAALKADLDALSTKLASVESTANAAKTTAESALAKANANATDIAAVKATAEKAAADAADALKKVATAQTTAEAAQAAADGAKTLAENAQKAADAAQATANAAQTAANAAQTAANAAQATANAAATKQELADAVKKVEDAAKALSDAAATKTELADAKTELKAYTDAAKAAALETAKASAEKYLADAKGYTDAEVVKINDNIKTLATQAAVEKLSKDLGDEITGLKNTLAAITDEEKMDKLVKVVGSFDTIVETLFHAVTSVELIASYSGSLDTSSEAISFPLGTLINPDEDANGMGLNFIFGKQKFTSKFGDKESESKYKDANEIIEYTEGVDIRAKQALLVRVNPVNAVFAKEDVKLIDSKGRNLDEIITIGEPYRYEGLITRGNTTETGLWVIPVSVKENTTLKDFNVVTFNEREYYTEADLAAKKCTQEQFEQTPKIAGKAILYAVAINNTADEADGRFVASTYDLFAEYKNFKALDNFYFTLYTKNSKDVEDKKNSTEVHNRWDDGTNIDKYTNEGKKKGILSWDQKNENTKSLTAYTLENPEQKWGLSKEATDAKWPLPADAAKKDGKLLNTTDADGDDYRYTKPFFYIEKVGQKITVSLTTTYKAAAEYWYITYDFEANAVESKPSEWEAWKSYQDGIQGIYTMTRGSQDIDLVINKAEAQGDVIGFRVWAVNYDGSLLDPDGKAFYVKVGEEPEAETLQAKATFMAVSDTAGVKVAYLYGEDTDKNFTAKKNFNVSIVTPISGNEFESLALSQNNGSKVVNVEGKTKGDVTIYWALLDKDNKLATNWKDIVAVKVGVAGSDLGKIADTAGDLLVETITNTRADANNKENYKIEIYAKKQMPDAAWTTENHYKDKFDWKSDYNPATGELTVYPKANNPGMFSPKVVGGKFFWNNNLNLAGNYANVSWTKKAVSAQRMINDYLSSTTVSATELLNYGFKLKGLPTTLKTPADTVYTTDWRNVSTEEIAAKTMMTVAPAAIDHSYNVDMNYTYKAISASYDSSKKQWKVDQDYTVAINSFKKVTFKDAMDLNTFDTKYDALSYYVDGNGNVIKKMANGQMPAATTATLVTKKDENLYIKWESEFKAAAANTPVADGKLYKAAFVDYSYDDSDPAPTTFNPATYEPTSFVVAGDLKSVLVTTTKQSDAARVLMRDAEITSNLDDDSFGFKEDWFKFQWNDDKTVLSAGDLKFEITGDAATYLKVDPNATLDAFKFQRTGWNNNANPQVNISGKIKISGNDVFGKERIFWIPFIIKHNL